jgi:ATP-dependent helicase Lhr and Lhr-like helicase
VPDVAQLLPEPEEAAELVLHQLGSTSLFAAKFRESAARALLLPLRRANGRAPLWQQRKRAYDLLTVASRYASFPMLLEAYRECLRDIFDMPALLQILRSIGNRTLRVHTVDARTPSPFASALLFSYVANYVYDGDAPLAERRAQALSIDQEQLRELMGDADLRELLDLEAIESTEEQLQCLVDTWRARNADGVHDLLLRLGDLTRAEMERRCVDAGVAASVDKLIRARRVLELQIAGEKRCIAIEDSARYRDALGVPLPPGVPTAFLDAAPEATTDLIRRYTRTHGPFTTAECAARFALPLPQVESILSALMQAGRVVEGGFRPGGVHREWCDAEVLRSIRRKSLARLRKEVEPVEQHTLAQLFTHWQGVLTPRRGLDALLDTIENLQGAPLPASLLESEILPARIANYKPGDLDTLIAAGEVIWCGLEPLGERDGRIGLYLAEKLPLLWTPRVQAEPLGGREEKILEYLREHGASFFAQVLDGTGGGYPGDMIEALWNLVWRGLITNDAMNALRAYCARPLASRPARRVHNQTGFRSRRTTPPTVQGRWALHPAVLRPAKLNTGWSHAIAQQLLQRYGVVFRETAHAENLPGGFSAIYDVMKALEESGRIRRGFFAADLGATQFALPAALDLLRSLRAAPDPERPEMLALAATDPANPYGALLRWPQQNEAGEAASLTRSVGARVLLCNGALAGYMRRGNPNLQLFLPAEEPQRSQVARATAHFLAELGQRMMGEEGNRTGMLITSVNGMPVGEHGFARFLLDAGFQSAPMGFNLRRVLLAPTASASEDVAHA